MNTPSSPCDSASDFSPDDLAALDARTRALGHDLFAHLPEQQPGFWRRRWWDDRVMEWSMRNAALKVALFRFVDVLPALAHSDDVVQRLFEYLDDVWDNVPAKLRAVLSLARRTALTRLVVARAARLSVRDFARRFIAGTNEAEVLAAARHEWLRGRCFTLDILGEAVTSETEADGYFRAYSGLIERLGQQVRAWPANQRLDESPFGRLPRLNLSIKLSALDCRFDAIDPDGVRRRAGGRLAELLRLARRHGAFVNVDMESFAKKDLTLAVFRSVLIEPEFRDFADVGIVIQAYLRDAEHDLVALRDWSRERGTPVWVRLVKGAYWDYETAHAHYHGWPVPVWQHKPETDANYERLTRFLLRHHADLRPALASHNLRSLAHGLAVAERLQLPPGAFELQMLYGMADAEQQTLVDRGCRLRIYMPYGELLPGMAYLVRRLLENTSDDSFLRAGFVEHRSPDELLRNPLDLLADHASTESGPTESGPTDNASTPETPMPRDAATPFLNEPPVDFAVESHRRAMHDALRSVLAQTGRTYPLVLGGQRIATDERQVSRDPSFRDRIVGEVACGDERHVEQAVALAKQAAPGWAALGAERRAEFLLKIARVLRERRFELAAWEVYECGKGWRESTADVAEAIDFCEYYARGAMALEQSRGADWPGEGNRYTYRPRGVAAVIAPWNFPLAILTGMTTAALATGNTVVMKPAEQSSVSAAILMDMATEVGLPPGVLNFLPGRGEVAGAGLVRHPDVSVIAFTGSRAVGLEIHRVAAEVSARGLGFVKRVIAEMGGKNGVVIDSDADLDEAVLGVIQSAFGYQGQKCSACSRAIVVGDLYEPFLARLVDAARSLPLGAAEDPATAIGPVIDAAAVRRIAEYVEIGRREGREVLAVDAAPWNETGWFVGPHIFADVPPESRLAQEEIFGPVLAVMRAANFDDALRIANGTEYALTAGVYSRSPAHLERAARELQAGNVYLNRPITGALVGRQPFGGYRLSGIGSQAGGPDYLLQFVLPRCVTENTMRRGFAPAESAQSPPR